MTIPVEVWVTRYMTGEDHRVSHGVFTFVAVDDKGKPIPVKCGSEQAPCSVYSASKWRSSLVVLF